MYEDTPTPYTCMVIFRFFLEGKKMCWSLLPPPPPPHTHTHTHTHTLADHYAGYMTSL